MAQHHYAALAAVLGLVVYYLYQRLCFARLQQFAKFPQPPRTLLWGHLKWIGQATKKLDKRSHFDLVLANERAALGNPACLLMDLRPIEFPMLVICDHEVAEQITRPSKLFQYSVPKSPTLKHLSALTGAHSMLTAEGDEWKTQRKRLSPGFAPQHLLTLLPSILDKTEIFTKHLDEKAASGEVFKFADLTTNLTFDIIGAVTMDMDLNAQLPGEESDILISFKKLAATYKREGKTILTPDFMAKRERKRIAAQLDKSVKKAVRDEYAKIQDGDESKQSRSVLNLSLKGVDDLSESLLQNISDNLRTFLFAGHDTTSILLTWLFYELERYPQAQKALRKELDDVLGTDVDFASIKEKLLAPGGGDLLSHMPYTAACMKEILRLHPPAGSARMAPKGSNQSITLPSGEEFIIDGLMLYINHYIIQRDTKVYGETANEFVPERWLTITADEGGDDKEKGDKAIPAGAWRPFERGPKGCIGLELANLEGRVIMACAARRYDFTKVGLGEFELDEKKRPILDEKGYYRTKSKMFQISQVTSRPVDDMVVKVRLSEQARRKEA